MAIQRTELYLLDDDGLATFPGDQVCFTYGIPTVYVTGDVIERDGELIILVPGHKPPEAPLRTLRSFVGEWYKKNV